MLETDVQWINPDGTGGARVEKNVLRLPGALPGDRVAYTVQSQRRRRIDAHVEHIVTPSSERRPTTCPTHDICGGCDLGAWQADARRAALAGVLHRTLGGDIPPIRSAPTDLGYRSRIKLALDPEGAVGYHPPRSHTVMDVSTCEIAEPILQDALLPLRTWWQANTDLPLASVELRTNGERVVYAFQRSSRGGRIDRERFAPLAHVALDGRRVAGDPVLQLDVHGVRLRASGGSFFQINAPLNTCLVGEVVARVTEVHAESVLDLYAGIGNFSLPIAKTGVPVCAVEQHGQAIEDLEAAALEQGLTAVRAIRCPVERFDPSRVAFDVVVLDPPRAGAPGVLPRLARNRPRRIVYVTCHAGNAARDVREIAKLGYRLVDVVGFDLFPRTHHLEAMLVLDR